MIDRETVFILGAGASDPYGFACGKNFNKKIIQDFHKSYIDLMNESHGKDYALYDSYKDNSLKFINKLQKSGIPSIDQFLAINKEFAEIGKAAITWCILEFEKKCLEPWSISGVDMDWYSYLYKEMISSIKSPRDIELFGQNKISFITFNYDRTLEHFLYTNLKEAMPESIPDDNIIKEVNKIFISHVYGEIAPLPWQSDNGLAFGGKLVFDRLNDISKKNIYLIDQIKNKGSFGWEQLIEAEKIIFLGFGYAEENMDVLELPQLLKDHHDKIIFGTGLGLTTDEIDRKKDSFKVVRPRHQQIGFPKKDINILTYDCLELLRNCLFIDHI